MTLLVVKHKRHLGGWRGGWGGGGGGVLPGRLQCILALSKSTLAASNIFWCCRVVCCLFWFGVFCCLFIVIFVVVLVLMFVVIFVVVLVLMFVVVVVLMFVIVVVVVLVLMFVIVVVLVLMFVVVVVVVLGGACVLFVFCVLLLLLLCFLFCFSSRSDYLCSPCCSSMSIVSLRLLLIRPDVTLCSYRDVKVQELVPHLSPPAPRAPTSVTPLLSISVRDVGCKFLTASVWQLFPCQQSVPLCDVTERSSSVQCRNGTQLILLQSIIRAKTQSGEATDG